MGSPSRDRLPSLPSIQVRPSLGGGTPPTLPEVLVAALRRAHAAELSATGEQRIPAFRLTRSLLAGARAAGYPNAAIARRLGVTVQSVSTRGGSDGWIAGTTFAELTDLSIRVISGWTADGLLPTKAVDAVGHDFYPASDLARALIRSAPATRG